MRVLIDTNVLLDVLCDRKEFVDASALVWKHCEIHDVEGYVSALSIPNIVYIMRKELSPSGVNEVLKKLSLIFAFADLKGDDLLKAARMEFGDYEDSLQMICAERIKAEYIITRNLRDFENSRVPALSPSDFLQRWHN